MYIWFWAQVICIITRPVECSYCAKSADCRGFCRVNRKSKIQQNETCSLSGSLPIKLNYPQNKFTSRKFMSMNIQEINCTLLQSHFPFQLKILKKNLMKHHTKNEILFCLQCYSSVRIYLLNILIVPGEKFMSKRSQQQFGNIAFKIVYLRMG